MSDLLSMPVKPIRGAVPDRSHWMFRDLVGWWMFNEGTGGSFSDISGYSNSGTFLNGVYWEPGKFGTCAGADGSLGFMEVPHGSQYVFGAGDWTVAFWARKRAITSGFDNIWGVAKWNTGGQPGTNEWSIGIGNGGSGNGDTVAVYVETGTSSIGFDSTTSLTIGQWHHIVGMRKGPTLYCFIDGIERGTANIGTATVNNNSRNLRIANSDLNQFYTDAQYDDVRIYRRAFSSEELAGLIASPFAPFQPRSTAVFALGAIPTNVYEETADGSIKLGGRAWAKLGPSVYSHYTENKLIDHLFRTTTYSMPSTLALCLCTSAPVPSDTGSLAGKEVTGGGYTRMSLSPGSNWTKSNGIVKYNATVTFPEATADWGSVTHWALCDSTTAGAGNLLFFGPLKFTKPIYAGSTVRIRANQLVINFEGENESSLLNGIQFFYKMDEPNGEPRIDATGRGNNLLSSTIPMANPSIDFRLASTAGNNQWFNGALDAVGKWNRILTPAERAALYAGGQGLEWPFTGMTSLQTGCLAFWKLDEASGNGSRADATGRGNSLSGLNSPTQVAGAGSGTGNATHFNGTNQALYRASNADLEISNSDWEMCCWLKFNTLVPSGGTVQGFIEKFDGSGAVEYALYYNYDHERFQVDLGDGQSLVNNAVVVGNKFHAANGQPAVDTWYFFSAWYDATANRLYMSINNDYVDYVEMSQPERAPGKVGVGYAGRYFAGGQYGEGVSGYDIAGPHYSYRNSNGSDDLSGGDNDFTVAFWIKLDQLGLVQHVVGKWNQTGNLIDWDFHMVPDNTLYFEVSDNGGSNFGYIGLPITDTNWHFVVGWHNAAANTVSIQIDNGTPNTSSPYGFTPAANSVQFRMGAPVGGSGNGGQLRGSIDAVGKWNRILTTDERTALWNGGNGIEYPFN